MPKLGRVSARRLGKDAGWAWAARPQVRHAPRLGAHFATSSARIIVNNTQAALRTRSQVLDPARAWLCRGTDSDRDLLGFVRIIFRRDACRSAYYGADATGLTTASGTISKVDSILAVFEIIAPTEQYLVSDSSIARLTAPGSTVPRNLCRISTRVK